MKRLPCRPAPNCVDQAPYRVGRALYQFGRAFTPPYMHTFAHSLHCLLPPASPLTSHQTLTTCSTHSEQGGKGEYTIDTRTHDCLSLSLSLPLPLPLPLLSLSLSLCVCVCVCVCACVRAREQRGNCRVAVVSVRAIREGGGPVPPAAFPVSGAAGLLSKYTFLRQFIWSSQLRNVNVLGRPNCVTSMYLVVPIA